MKRVLQFTAWASVGVCVCLASVSVAHGDKKKEKATKEATGGQAEDKTFAHKAGVINLSEVNLGGLAARLSSDRQVIQYGQQLARDHYRANERLNMILGKENIPAATEMDQKHAALWKKLSGMTGKSFDQEFLQAMIKGHKEAIELFQGQSKNGQNAALKEYAQQTLPALQEHLKMAQGLAGKSKNEGTEKQGTGQQTDK